MHLLPLRTLMCSPSSSWDKPAMIQKEEKVRKHTNISGHKVNKERVGNPPQQPTEYVKYEILKSLSKCGSYKHVELNA